jgi:hypothetical protein
MLTSARVTKHVLQVTGKWAMKYYQIVDVKSLFKIMYVIWMYNIYVTEESVLATLFVQRIYWHVYKQFLRLFKPEKWDK